uniref:Uncharacterized protein n=1 Tax=Rangifer tarandus platyrhynchus TaxID=3082113 RepID=A0ACB0E5A2_RANTA|nr:unnamed protein product [Rangifer tarandus platyrhynchus]
MPAPQLGAGSKQRGPGAWSRAGTQEEHPGHRENDCMHTCSVIESATGSGEDVLGELRGSIVESFPTPCAPVELEDIPHHKANPEFSLVRGPSDLAPAQFGRASCESGSWRLRGRRDAPRKVSEGDRSSALLSPGFWKRFERRRALGSGEPSANDWTPRKRTGRERVPAREQERFREAKFSRLLAALCWISWISTRVTQFDHSSVDLWPLLCPRDPTDSPTPSSEHQGTEGPPGELHRPPRPRARSSPKSQSRRERRWNLVQFIKRKRSSQMSMKTNSSTISKQRGAIVIASVAEDRPMKSLSGGEGFWGQRGRERQPPAAETRSAATILGTCGDVSPGQEEGDAPKQSPGSEVSGFRGGVLLLRQDPPREALGARGVFPF